MKTDHSESTWARAFEALQRRETWTMLFLGFAAGLPILLIFSSLSLWLREAGVSRSVVTYFSWAALGYSFKFIWAPLIDQLPIPLLTRHLGRRRSWMLVSQISVILAICGMAFTDPAGDGNALTLMALFAVLLGFSSATQDIVIDAYRIESAEEKLQAMLASTYIAGYRIGMIAAGAGALYLADFWGSTNDTYNYVAWQNAYLCMAAAMLIGIATTLLMPEPKRIAQQFDTSNHENLRLIMIFAVTVAVFILAFSNLSPASLMIKDNLSGPFGSLLAETFRMLGSLLVAGIFGFLIVKIGLLDASIAQRTWVAPVSSFFRQHGIATSALILALIGLYRISDIVLGVMSNVFYQDLGFSKTEIASAVKTFGVIISIAGSFMGGIWANQYGVLRCLMLGGILAALTNLAFIGLAVIGHNVIGLYAVVGADNLAAGFASAAFVAFLSSLTQIQFTAVQYAIFSSLMTLLPKTLGGYSGGMVDALGYPTFFTLTTLMGIPVLYLIYLVSKRMLVELPKAK